MAKNTGTHTVMSKKLADALMESGMVHFDGGGGLFGGIGSAITGVAGDFTATNHYNAGLAPTDYSNYQTLIGQAGTNALGGYGTAQDIRGQQQELANALLARSQGQGPDPALAALSTATGQNVASTGALMAGQRGAGANPALLARQAGQAGASIQQNAVGQAATLKAQQEIAAQQALAQQQMIMGQQNIQEQAANTGILGAGITGQTGQNNTSVANVSQMQQLNQNTAQNNANATNKTTGGIIGGIGDFVGGFLGLAHGGKIGHLPDHLQKIASIHHPEFYGSKSEIKPIEMKKGGKVPGKAKVKGDSPKNDRVLALLSPEEEVLPRSVTMAPDAPARAASFVKHLQEKEGAQKGYGKVAASKKSLKERVENLEKMCGGGVAA